MAGSRADYQQFHGATAPLHGTGATGARFAGDSQAKDPSACCGTTPAYAGSLWFRTCCAHGFFMLIVPPAAYYVHAGILAVGAGGALSECIGAWMLSTH